MLNSKQMKNLKTKYPRTMVIMMLFASALFFQFTVGCNQGPPEGSRAKQAMRGADIFKVQCAPCHGMGEIAPTVDTLSILAADLTQITQRWGTGKFPVGEIARYIDGRKEVAAHGPRVMPVWGEVYKAEGMDETEIKGRKGELIAYLMSIQK